VKGARGARARAQPLARREAERPIEERGIHVEARLHQERIDTKTCREYLSTHAPSFVAAFDESIQQAEDEQD